MVRRSSRGLEEGEGEQGSPPKPTFFRRLSLQSQSSQSDAGADLGAEAGARAMSSPSTSCTSGNDDYSEAGRGAPAGRSARYLAQGDEEVKGRETPGT